MLIYSRKETLHLWSLDELTIEWLTDFCDDQALNMVIDKHYTVVAYITLNHIIMI